MNVKKILLKCTPQTLGLLTSTKFEDILPSNPHLPDIQYPYPGVYGTGMFIHADGTAPSIRDCIRVANIILRPQSIKKVFEGQWLGGITKRGLRLYGMKLRERLGSIDCWLDVDELLEEIEVLDDSEEDDDDDSDYIPEETDDRYQSLSIPNTLKDAKFDARFPWTSVYGTGYTKDFNRRKKFHASSNSFAEY